jgi:Flp pilus assembly protein TadG
MTRPVFPRKLHSDQGQSLVEITLFIPIMLLMLVGFVEIGTFVNDYITVTDTTRSAARYVSVQDPTETGCGPFGPGKTEEISFAGNCVSNMSAAYKTAAATVKGWGADRLYQVCLSTETVNFYYVAGCSVVRSLKSDMGTVLSTTEDIDVVVTTVPITGGLPMPDRTVTWSLYGNKTSGFLKVSPPASVNDFEDSFKTELNRYSTAPSTGVVIVEVYASHKQVTGLFTFVSRLAGGNAVLPDPIPIHVYSIFPLVALDPARFEE